MSKVTAGIGGNMSTTIVMALIIATIIVTAFGLIVEVLKRDAKKAFASFGLIVMLTVGAKVYYSFIFTQSENTEQIVIDNQINVVSNETEQKNDSLSEKETILLGIALAAIISLPIIIPKLQDTFETEDASKKQS